MCRHLEVSSRPPADPRVFQLARFVLAVATALQAGNAAWAQCAPSFNQQLGPAVPAVNEYYGGSLSVDGGRALVGSDGDYFGHGGCYVYNRNSDGSWSTNAFLTASDGVYGDVFGNAASLSGNRALVGAYLRAEVGRASGAAYVFDYANGNWTQAAKIVPADAATADWFGYALALTGSTAAIGAPYADVGYSRSGAVYIFDRAGSGAWSQTTKLTISEPGGVLNYIFGWAVALNGNTLAAGAPGYAFGGQIFIPGYVYVFERSNGVWSQTARLGSSDGVWYDTFGSAVAISGSTMLIGAPLRDDACPSDPSCQSGAAYVFDKISGVWTQTAKLVAPDALQGDVFGSSVALDGDLAVIGAPGVDSPATSAGANYVFHRVNGVWTYVAKQNAPTVAGGDALGTSVAAGSGSILSSAPYHSNTASIEHSGAVYSFLQSTAQPAVIVTQPAGVNVEDSQPASFTVSASGTAPLTYQWQKDGVDLANGPNITGATGATLSVLHAGFGDAGNYQVIVQNPCSSVTSIDAPLIVTCALPQQQARFAPETGSAGLAGSASALRGTRAVVGAWGDAQNGPQSGAAWVYEQMGGVWQPGTKLTPQDGSANAYDEFGWSVAVDGDTVVVGARYDQASFNYNAGSAFVFERSGGVWTQTARLTAADGGALEEFGGMVAVSDTTLAITSRVDSQEGEAAGSIYIFDKVGGVWMQTTKLLPPDLGYHSYFGSALALSGDVLLAGAPGDSAVLTNGGAVYVFERSGGNWSQTAKLYSPDSAAFANFATAVALDGITGLVADVNNPTVGNQAGAVHVLRRVGGVWQFIQTLAAPDAAPGDWFGSAVGLLGDTAIVGAEFADAAGANSGAAYVFQQINSVWTQAAKLTATGAAAYDDFGHTVAVGEGGLLVGAPDADGPASNCGAAYAFNLPGVPPSITVQPLPLAVGNGATAAFSVTATGSAPVYQWRRNAANLADNARVSGAHSAHLTIANVNVDDAGSYDVVVTNDCGTVTSNGAQLTVGPGCLGDLNGDHQISLADLNILLANYGHSGATYAQGDLNGSMTVDLSDLSLMLGVFGSVCP